MPLHHDARLADPQTGQGPGVTLDVGAEIPPFERTITREMALLNAGPLRNFHTDLEEARALGFDDLVIAGPLFTCFYSEMLTRRFGADWIESGDLEFKLLRPVLAGQTIAARARVMRCEPVGGAMRVALEVWCERRDDGATTSVGTAELCLRRSP